MEKGLRNDNFSFLPLPLVSSIQNQSKLPKSLLVVVCGLTLMISVVTDEIFNVS